MLTGTRLPRPAHRDDPRQRPRHCHRTLRRWCRIRRFLGRQDPHCPPKPAPRRRLGWPTTSRPIPLDPRPGRRVRSSRDPQLQPQRRHRLGRLTRRDDRRRPQNPRQHLARSRTRSRRPCRPPSPPRRHPRTPRAVRPRRVPHRTRNPSTSSPPAQAHPLPWSPHSSKTSSKPPGDSPPAHPEHGSTHPCYSPSTRSGTSHPSHPYPC